MTTVAAEYDKGGAAFSAWRKAENLEGYHNYMIFNCLLKRVANTEGELSEQRVLDLGCGNGHHTRRLKAMNCAFILGVDISSTIIEMASNDELCHPQGIEYMVADAINLSLPIESFDLVTGFYFLNYARTKEELVTIAQNIFSYLRHGKYFIGVTTNVLAPRLTFNRNEYKKYGFSLTVDIPPGDDPIPDGTPVNFTLYDDEGKIMSSYTNCYLSSEVYEQAFKEAGFTLFEWVPFQCDPNLPNRAFFDDYAKHPHAVGIIAKK